MSQRIKKKFRGGVKSRKFVKIDEEDMPIYEDIINMLQKAGYYRIRIKDLSPFDKVVGGLVWSISNANVDVEVGNLFFHEEPNLGQKAAISDGIVRSLRLMGCPHRLQSFQIMGLDLKIIHQVFKWLIEKVFETREENTERIRRYSELVFSKNYQIPQDLEREEKIAKGKPYLNSIKGLYESKRMFRQKVGKLKKGRVRKKRKFNWDHVQGVLLEYGKEFHIVKKRGKSKKGARQEVQRAKNEEIKIKSLKRRLEALNEETVVSNTKLNQAVLIDKENLSELNVSYEDLKKKIGKSSVAMNEEILHKHTTKNKEKQILKLREILKEKKLEVQKLIELVKQKKANVANVSQKNEEIKGKIEEYNNLLDNLNDEEKEALNKLRQLIELNENLKHHEKQFRAQCKVQLQDFNEKIQELKDNVKANIEGSQNKANAKIEKIKKLAEKKHSSLRKKLLKENKKEILLLRTIDEIPISSELKQFEKRLSELINLILKNDKETRKYYDTYNTHSRILEYTEKKFSLFNSILEKYSKSLNVNQKKYSQWVLDSVKKSLEQVQTSKEIVVKKTQAKKVKSTTKTKLHSELVQEKRDYFRSLKAFEDEVKRNEELNEKLERLKENIKKKKEEIMKRQIAKKKKEIEEKKKKRRRRRKKKERIRGRNEKKNGRK